MSVSTVKNVSGGPRYVPLLDREVADGEIVEVPDFQPAHNPDSKPGDPDYLAIAWPEAVWEPVSAKDAKAAAKASAAGTADDTSGKAAS